MIKLVNVSKYYHNDGIVTQGLNKVNLEFNVGELIAITGESGSGKSTLLNVISGQDSYEDGELTIDGEETSYFDDSDWERYRKDKVGFIFQQFNLIDSYTVLKNVEVVLVIQGVDRKTRRKKALEIIDKVGLTSRLRSRASKLSGGEKQRLAIARALAKETKLIVADEPTGNLDSESGKEVINLLSKISKDRLVIVVTHNFDAIKDYATRKIRLFDGEVVEDVILKKVEAHEFVSNTKAKISKFNKIATISQINLLQMPKRTILTAIVSFTLILFIYLLFGTYIIKYYSEPLQNPPLNIYPERLIVKKQDGSPLLDEDYQYFLSDNRISSIIKEDYIMDSLITIGDNNFVFSGKQGNITFSEYNVNEIIGRLPENEGEILVSSYLDPDYNFNIELELNKMVTFNFGSYSRRNLKVVGIHISNEETTKFVINPNLLRSIYQDRLINVANPSIYYIKDNQIQMIRNRNIFINNQLKDNEIMVSNNQYFFLNQYPVYFNGVSVTPVITFNNIEVIYISPNLYHQFIEDDYFQYTLNLRNPQEASNVVNTLYEKGYYAFSPYTNNVPTDDSSVMLNTLFQVAIFFIILIVYIFSYLIVRTIMASKIRDYSILRSMGVERKLIRYIILFELVICFLMSSLVFFIFVPILSVIFPNEIGNFTKYFQFNNYLIIFALNLLIAFLISRKFFKYLEKKSLVYNLRGE